MHVTGGAGQVQGHGAAADAAPEHVAGAAPRARLCNMSGLQPAIIVLVPRRVPVNINT